MGNWLVIAALGAGLLFSTAISAPAEKIVFLDVGQGDAILLQAGTEQVLIDGGPDATVLRRLGEEMPALDRTIEVVVATHPDKDHIAGLVHVLERYNLELVILPQVSHTSQLQAAWLTHIQDALAKKHTQYRFAVAGQRIELDDLTLDVLHPGVGETFGKKTNNASVTLRGNYCAAGPTTRSQCISFLLTGDAEAVIERQLVQKSGSMLDVDVLKAGHHGSKTSTSPEFLAATSPSTVVISVGRDNQYGHPYPDVLERLKKYQVWRTDERGSVRFVQEKGTWLISANRH